MHSKLLLLTTTLLCLALWGCGGEGAEGVAAPSAKHAPVLAVPDGSGGAVVISGAAPAYTAQAWQGGSLALVFGASDQDGDTLATTISVSGGTLTAAQAGFAQALPAGDTGVAPLSVALSGTASSAGTIVLTISTQDGNGGSDTITLALTIGTNQPPQAVSDNAVTNQNTPASIDVLANDSDPDGDALVLLSVSTPQHGSVQAVGGQALYSPATNYVGNDSFNYTVGDGKGGSAAGTVSVSVKPAWSVAGISAPVPTYAPIANSVVLCDRPGGLPQIVVGEADQGGGSIGPRCEIIGNQSIPGSVSLAAQSNLAAFGIPLNMATGDLNGDGLTDVAMSDTIGGGSPIGPIAVLVFLQNAAAPGSFLAAQYVPLQGNPAGAFGAMGLAIGDIDGDGKNDIVASTYSIQLTNASTVEVLRNTTAPGAATLSFSAAYLLPFGGYTGQSFVLGVAIADFNADGRKDVVFSTDNGEVEILTSLSSPGNIGFWPALRTLHSNQTGTFGNTWLPQMWSVAVGDLNGDGKPDVAAGGADNWGGSIGDCVVWLNQTASPTTAAPTFSTTFITIGAGGPAHHSDTVGLWIGDLNGDGAQDIVAANNDIAGLRVHMNETAPGATALSMQAPRQFATAAPAPGFAVGDVDGDGIADIVATNLYTGANPASTVVVLRGQLR